MGMPFWLVGVRDGVGRADELLRLCLVVVFEFSGRPCEAEPGVFAAEGDWAAGVPWLEAWCLAAGS